MAEYKTLAEALAAFQAVVPKMSKDETAKVKSEKANYTYGYAGLDQFVEIVEPVLGTHGLAVTSKTVFTPEGGFMLEVALVHESGERETAVWPLPDPRRSGPQDIGSAMTYGRRYLGWGLTGTFPGGVDDDGAQAQQTARESWESAQPRPTATQAHNQHARGVNADKPVSSPPAPPAVRKTAWSDVEVAEQHAKIVNLPMDQAVVLYDWMAGKGLHGRGIGPSGKTATLLLALRIGDAALLPDAAPEEIATLRDLADGRGLLKIKVSESETLDEVLHTGRELAVHAAVAQAKADTPDPDTLRDEERASWDARDEQSPGSAGSSNG